MNKIVQKVVLIAALAGLSAASAHPFLSDVKPVVVMANGVAISYIQADVTKKADTTIILSSETVRSLNDPVQTLAGEKILEKRLLEILKNNKPATVRIQMTPSNSLVVQVAKDEKGAFVPVVYANVPVCPAWVAQTVSKAFNGAKTQPTGISGLAKAAIGGVVAATAWLTGALSYVQKIVMGSSKETRGEGTTAGVISGSTSSDDDVSDADDVDDAGDVDDVASTLSAVSGSSTGAGAPASSRRVDAEVTSVLESVIQSWSDALDAFKGQTGFVDFTDGNIREKIARKEYDTMPQASGPQAKDDFFFNEILQNVYLGDVQFTQDLLCGSNDGYEKNFEGAAEEVQFAALKKNLGVVVFVGDLDQRIAQDKNPVENTCCDLCVEFCEANNGEKHSGHDEDSTKQACKLFCAQNNQSKHQETHLAERYYREKEFVGEEDTCARPYANLVVKNVALKKAFGLEEDVEAEPGRLYEAVIDDIKVMYVPLREGSEDRDSFNKYFFANKEYVFAQMDNAIVSGKHVLVHCQDGVNRSLAVLCAYLHSKLGEQHSMYSINSLIASKRKLVKTFDVAFSVIAKGEGASGATLLGAIKHCLGVEPEPYTLGEALQLAAMAQEALRATVAGASEYKAAQARLAVAESRVQYVEKRLNAAAPSLVSTTAVPDVDGQIHAPAVGADGALAGAGAPVATSPAAPTSPVAPTSQAACLAVAVMASAASHHAETSFDLSAAVEGLPSAVEGLPSDIFNADGSVDFSHEKFAQIATAIRSDLLEKTAGLEDVSDENLASLIKDRRASDELSRLGGVQKSDPECRYGLFAHFEMVGKYFGVGDSDFSGEIVTSKKVMTIESLKALAMPDKDTVQDDYLYVELSQLATAFKAPSKVPGLVVVCAEPSDASRDSSWYKRSNFEQNIKCICSRESYISTMYIPLVERKNVNSFEANFILDREARCLLDKAVAASLLAGYPIFFNCNSGSNRSTTMLQYYLKKLCPDISWRKINAWVCYHRGATQSLRDAFTYNSSRGYGEKYAVRDLIVYDFKMRGLLEAHYNIYSPAVVPLPVSAAPVGVSHPVASAREGVVCSASSSGSLRARRASEESVFAEPVDRGILDARLDQLVADIRSFESHVLAGNKMSDGELLQRLHTAPTAYPVDGFPDQQVFETTTQLNVAQPFHKIMDGLYLGNNYLTLNFKKHSCVDVSKFNTIQSFDDDGEDLVVENNENMDKPPTLIICVDADDALYDSIKSTDDIEFIYFPLREKEGNDFNEKFISSKQALFGRIIEHLSRPDGRVLIHCAQGNHRSVSVLHCFLVEALRTAGQPTDLYSINQFIKSKRSLAMSFAELAEKEYKNKETPCMPPESSMLYQTLVHYCGSSDRK